MNKSTVYWESDDGMLLLMIENKVVFVTSGRVNFYDKTQAFSIDCLDNSWFLTCENQSQTMELISKQEMLSVSKLLNVTPVNL